MQLCLRMQNDFAKKRLGRLGRGLEARKLKLAKINKKTKTKLAKKTKEAKEAEGAPRRCRVPRGQLQRKATRQKT